MLGEHDLVLSPGEVVEFDTQVPHWFDNPGPEPVEVLSLFGPQGERFHVRARLPSSRGPDPAEPHELDTGPLGPAGVVDQHRDRSTALRTEPGEGPEPTGGPVVPPQVTGR